MIVKGPLFIVNVFIATITSAAVTIIFFKNYTVQVLTNNVFGKLVFCYLNIHNTAVCSYKKYLEQIKIVLKYRIYYENVTRPMKIYYKELRRK